MPGWVERIPGLLEPWTRACCSVPTNMLSDDDEEETSSANLEAIVSKSTYSEGQLGDHHMRSISTLHHHIETPASPSADSTDRVLGQALSPVLLTPEKVDGEENQGGERATGDKAGMRTGAQLPKTMNHDRPVESQRRWNLRDGQGPDDVSTEAPQRTPGGRRAWSDETLEEFLRTTLVEGSGLVLMKRNSEGKDNKLRERVVSYDPERMKLSWAPTGVLRKAGGIFAKDIEEVICEGRLVTIVPSAGAAPSTPGRETNCDDHDNSGKRSRHGSARGQRKRKVFETTKTRDAQILQAILLLVRRKARQATDANTGTGDPATSTGTTTPADAAAGVGTISRSPSVSGSVAGTGKKGQSPRGGWGRLQGMLALRRPSVAERSPSPSV